MTFCWYGLVIGADGGGEGSAVGVPHTVPVSAEQADQGADSGGGVEKEPHRRLTLIANYYEDKPKWRWEWAA
jgi:hypothetical protein